MNRFYLLSLFSLLNCLFMSAQTLKLNPLISDNMVLQQQCDVTIWGTAKPNDDIMVITPWGSESKTVTQADGNWYAKIKTISAGGPYEISISSKTERIKIKNIMLGEVWLCSGQSNMEMPLAGWPPNDSIEGSSDAIAKSLNENIRMFTVQRNFSLEPMLSCNGSWEVASPVSSPSFSATAYFFAKKLQKELNIPIGIIHSSWGGTPIESWISPIALATHSDFKNEIENQKNLLPLVQNYNKWLLEHKTMQISWLNGVQNWKNLDFEDAFCSAVTTNDDTWGTIEMPCRSWESTDIGEFDGVIWFRKHIDIKKIANDGYDFLLPGIDDMDRVYVNGTLVGSTEEPGFWQTPRLYKIPKGILKTGKNLIAIRIMDTQGGGGLGSTETAFELKSGIHTIPLIGSWKYSVAAEYKNSEFYLIDIKKNEWFAKPKAVRIGQNTACVLYNAMIHPLLHYNIKGTVWYQGESNVGRAEQYYSLLQLLAGSWRSSWQISTLPMYVVQIAPWVYSGKENYESGELRNAQRKATEIMGNSGLVVTLDIGNIANIHPPKKREVGERLALWALHKKYGKHITCSGPILISKRIINNAIELEFDFVGSGIVLKNTSREFEIAGIDKKFVKADAIVVDNKIKVSSTSVLNPMFVRYAFRNGSEATLFNGEGLPASTFETE